MKQERLTASPWFQCLPQRTQEALVKKVRFKQYEEGQMIHSKLSEADGLYCVLSGEVKVSATTANGEELVLTILCEGQWFGEIALLDGGLRTHDTHALTQCEIAILPKPSILAAIKNAPEVYEALVKLLCEHTRLAFQSIDNFLSYKPAHLMAKIIIDKCNKQSNNFIDIKQSELGSMVGISRQSTNKILKKWEQQGLIERSYCRLTIIDSAKLIAKVSV